MDYIQFWRRWWGRVACVWLTRKMRVEILANRGAEERLGSLMLYLTASQIQKYGESTSEVSIVVFPISHNELAQMTAMSRPHVSVTMSKLREQGFVDYDCHRPLAVNVPVLRKHLTGE